MGAILFLVFFLLIAPPTRHALEHMMATSAQWISDWAPFSYVILALLVVAAIAAYYMMVRWPAPVEPENPLARYHDEDICD
jgi:hypothetical protein